MLRSQFVRPCVTLLLLQLLLVINTPPSTFLTLLRRVDLSSPRHEYSALSNRSAHAYSTLSSRRPTSLLYCGLKTVECELGFAVISERPHDAHVRRRVIQRQGSHGFPCLAFKPVLRSFACMKHDPHGSSKRVRRHSVFGLQRASTHARKAHRVRRGIVFRPRVRERRYPYAHQFTRRVRSGGQSREGEGEGEGEGESALPPTPEHTPTHTLTHTYTHTHTHARKLLSTHHTLHNTRRTTHTHMYTQANKHTRARTHAQRWECVSARVD